MAKIGIAVIFLMAFVTYNNVYGKSPFSWMKYDHFDEIDAQIRSVTPQNCRSKSPEELTMRKDTVAQLPVYNELLSRIWYRNRTSLIHIHNMAFNRALFFSYVLQRMNDSDSFHKQPNWMYFYFSTAADVNANPYLLNGSALYFDNDCHYPNWYRTVPFNKTLNLFGPKAYRWDDYQDQDNFLREPTRKVVKVVDFSAGTAQNYTHSKFKMNPWYPTWLPDLTGDLDSLTKFTYYIGIQKSNVTGEFETDTFENYAFFGPSMPSATEKDERKLPVQFTAPYFDCGGSDKWVVSAVSPVIDFMPRYSNYTHLRRPRIVALSVMDTDFIELDFNACGVSPGNPGPSYLSGVARCRPKTGCKHKIGYGFRRGGYICHCKGAWTYPWDMDQPFQGEDVEEATEEEYESGFQCHSVQYRLVLPVVDNLSGVKIEGGGIFTNSGGLNVERQRRAAGNETDDSKLVVMNWNAATKYSANQSEALPQKQRKLTLEEQNEEFSKPVVERINGHTIPEIMIVAEKLKELREKGDLKKTLKFENGEAVFDFSQQIDDYADKNSVSFDIERQYESDVKLHKAYKKMLKENEVNYTVASAALRDSIIQVRDNHIERFNSQRRIPKHASRKKRAAIHDEQAFDRMMRIMRWKSSVNADNCHDQPNHRLFLPGDVGYGVESQFQPEGQTALRLTNFLSMYLQNVMPDENYGNLRGGGRLHVDQMYGEVLANVMANHRIYSAGLYFDRYKFENTDGTVREFFGPWAFRRKGAFYAIDTAGYSSYYTDEDWFIKAKARYAANFHGLITYKIRAFVRNDPNGTSSVRHEFFPIIYKAAPYNLGYWTRPHFRCDGRVDSWVMTYVSPFFGMDRLRTKLEFRGVATVDVPLSMLEFNQCPQPFHVPNAFKNTARCDYFSTRCVQQPGFPFMRGSYRCLCRMGFEYWHADGKFWIEGSLVELEYEKKKAGIFSRFDLLNCRVQAASSMQPSVFVVLVVTTVSFISQWKKE